MGVINNNAFVSFDIVVADQSAQIEFIKTDSTIEDYLHAYLESDRVSFRAEEETIEFEAPGNAGTDNLLIYSSSANGRILQNTSIITDNNIWEIDHDGTISGASASQTINAFNYDAAGIEINDGAANAVILRGGLFEMDGITATAVGLSTLEGLRINLPAINTVYNDGAGIIITENTNDCIVEIITTDGYGLSITGDTLNSGRTWGVIAPSGTITDDVNNILLDIDITGATINDGANTPEIRLLRLNADGITETEVDGTTLEGIRVEMPDVSSYSSGFGFYCSEGTRSVTICDGSVGLSVIGGMSLDTLDLTPTSDADALDIDLTNDNFVSATAIDINIGDYTGGNIISLEFTEASTLGATDTNLILLHDNGQLTLNDAGQDFKGIFIDLAGTTVTSKNTAYGLYIHTPAGFDGALYTTDGTYITTLSNGSNALNTSDGSRTITLCDGSNAIFIDADTTDISADSNLINIDAGIAANVSCNMINISMDFSGSMAATDSCNGLYIDINENAVHNDGAILRAISTIMTGYATGRADMYQHLMTFDGTKNGGDSSYGLYLTGSMTLNNASEIFRGVYIDLSGFTNTSSSVFEGLNIQMINASDTAINTNAKIVTDNIDIGGGYGATGVTVDTNGNVQMNGSITVDTNATVSGTLDWSANPCKPKIYSQSSEPDIPNDTMAFWWDTNLTQMWLIIDMGGTQYKVQLT
ncbi:MAG: hypothetical protein ACTSQJ_00260 [Promethearchaeota archaeon]